MHVIIFDVWFRDVFFFSKGPKTLLRASSPATRVKITTRGTSDRVRDFFFFRSAKVACRSTQPGGPRV